MAATYGGKTEAEWRAEAEQHYNNRIRSGNTNIDEWNAYRQKSNKADLAKSNDTTPGSNSSVNRISNSTNSATLTGKSLDNYIINNGGNVKIYGNANAGNDTVVNYNNIGALRTTIDAGFNSKQLSVRFIARRSRYRLRRLRPLPTENTRLRVSTSTPRTRQ